jgi:hypothetical protein
MNDDMALEGPDDTPRPVFVGTCRLFRTVPRLVLVVALAVLVSGNLLAALVMAGGTLLVAAVVPWRYVVFDEGVLLSFAVRADRFFSKRDIAIRSDPAGAVLYPTPSARRGYALSDGLLERRRATLRAVLVRHGFRLA